MYLSVGIMLILFFAADFKWDLRRKLIKKPSILKFQLIAAGFFIFEMALVFLFNDAYNNPPFKVVRYSIYAILVSSSFSLKSDGNTK